MKNLAATQPLSAGSRFPERRECPRYAFDAPADLRDPVAKTRLAGRATSISKKGCFVQLPEPFAVESVVQLHIQKGDTAFETWAKVIQGHPPRTDGMALVFIGTAPQQEQLLEQWLAELAAESRHNAKTC
jgi:PilZ domain